MRIDLHTHSTCSDGSDTPADLIARAAQAHLDVVALTDHDTTQGWVPAGAAAEHHGIHLVHGIELSTRNEGRGQHLLGYAFDAADAALVAMLARGNEAREGRIAAILERLAEHGVDVSDEQVRAEVADGGTVGRPHIAAAMMTAGHVQDRAEAFEDYLKPGAKAYVERYAPDIVEAIGVIAAAGGVTVLAHPRGRNSVVPEARFAELQAAGLTGIEVDHQEHDAAARAELRAIAGNLGLVVTGSSDYHGTHKTDHELGCNLTGPAELERLLGSLPR